MKSFATYCLLAFAATVYAEEAPADVEEYGAEDGAYAEEEASGFDANNKCIVNLMGTVQQVGRSVFDIIDLIDAMAVSDNGNQTW